MTGSGPSFSAASFMRHWYATRNARQERTGMKKPPYNVEFFYRGCMRKSEEWPVVLGALIFFGAQAAFALFLFFR